MIARVYGKTDARDYDYECVVVTSRPEEAVLLTKSEPQHQIVVKPRYTGGSLHEPTPDANGATVCSFSFDGEYVALADYFSLRGGVLVVPHDHAPKWIYEVSDEERAQVQAALDAIRLNIDA